MSAQPKTVHVPYTLEQDEDGVPEQLARTLDLEVA
jgi:hypothetical protein